MLISIDHGNKLIKTGNKIFTSGYRESDSKPPFGDNVLKFKGKFYTLSDKRIPYMRDKTIDERFFILTLFAIAFEIDKRECHSKDIIPISLLIGLPPAHFGAQYEKFKQYFVRGEVDEFEFNGKPQEIFINTAIAYPQAFAAAMPVYNQIYSYPKVIVLDIGGFTADFLLVKNGQADLSACDTLENGVIILYNQIIAHINSDFDMLLEESDIDAILNNQQTEFDEGLKQIVHESAQVFINDLFSMLRERMIDLRSGRTVFVGGGSILLRKQIEASGKVAHPIFVDNITANAKGYELLFRASSARR